MNKELILGPFVAIVVIIVIGIGVWNAVPDHDAMKMAKLAFAYTMLTLLFLFGFLIVTAMATGKIDIGSLLTEGHGKLTKASMSRFQLLIFTFVIGISFFYVVVCNCEMPKVPAEVLTLLGISASTYGVSKGIHAGTTDKDPDEGAAPPASPKPAAPAPGAPAPHGD